MRFHVITDWAKIKTYELKGENKAEMEENFRTQVREWIENDIIKLKYVMFEIERQIESSERILSHGDVISKVFTPKSVTHEQIIEDNKKVLRFIKEEFNMELTDSDGSIFRQELETGRQLVSFSS